MHFQLFGAAFIGMLIAPFWLNYYELGIGQLVLFCSLWVSLKWLIMAVKGKLNVHLRGLRSLFRSIPLFVGAIIVWEVCYRAFQSERFILSIILIILNVLISSLLTRRRFTSIGTFEQDLAIDDLEKNKYMNLIFAFSMDIEKLPKPPPLRKSPRLYSKSNRLFKNRIQRNGFLELFIKVSTRNVEYILGYIKIFGVTSAAVITLPTIWLKITLICIGFLFLLSWNGFVWNKVIGSHPFTKKYAEEDGHFIAKKIVTIVLAIPFIIIIGFSIILNLWIRAIFPFSECLYRGTIGNNR